MAHQTKWMWGAAGLAVVAGLALVTWAVQESARFYASSHRPNVPPAVNAQPTIQLRESSREVQGAVHLEVEIESLEDGERVIVMRDIVKILEDRLRSSGVKIDATGRNVLSVQYREERGQSLDVDVPGTRGRSTIESITPTRVTLRVQLDQPGRPRRLLGQKTIAPTQASLETLTGQVQQALNRLRRQLYQQSYRAALDYLRRIELPTRQTSATHDSQTTKRTPTPAAHLA
jgi:hypothetical protein